MARTDSLNILLDPSGKMKLKEVYKGVIDNVQKLAVSVPFKNTDLSGDPEGGSIEAKRFQNANIKTYGTARTAGKGDAAQGKPVVINIDQDKEIVEELEQKDVSLLGVDGLIAKRTSNHANRMAAHLDTVFFDVAKTGGSHFKPEYGTTAIEDRVEASFVALEELKNNYVDGVDRMDMVCFLSSSAYSKMRKYLDDVKGTNVYTTEYNFLAYHDVVCVPSSRLPQGVEFITMRRDSVAQPVKTDQYTAEKINLADAIALELFFYYGCECVTPDLILWSDGTCLAQPVTVTLAGVHASWKDATKTNVITKIEGRAGEKVKANPVGDTGYTTSLSVADSNEKSYTPDAQGLVEIELEADLTVTATGSA